METNKQVVDINGDRYLGDYLGIVGDQYSVFVVFVRADGLIVRRSIQEVKLLDRWELNRPIE